MSPLQGRLPHHVNQRFPSVRLTGRCFLLRPRRHASAASALHNDVECIDLTQGCAAPSYHQPRSMPGSLMGNSYYAQRYNHSSSVTSAGTTPAASPSRFLSGDVILRLHLSAVPRGLSGRRIVDVTGTQTSYLDSSERDAHALATVEEALQTMHLHDGHEVPALQRGDVDLVRLQPQCVYAPSPSTKAAKTAGRGGGGALARGAPVLDLTSVGTVLYPLDNPGVLLAQSRRLTFRSEMDAMQVARVMAASVAELSQGATGPHAAASSFSSSGAVLKPLVRDGQLVGVTLRTQLGPNRRKRG